MRTTGTAALSRLATCAIQASDVLPWAVVCRGVVDGRVRLFSVKAISLTYKICTCGHSLFGAFEREQRQASVFPASFGQPPDANTRRHARVCPLRRAPLDIRAAFCYGVVGRETLL